MTTSRLARLSISALVAGLVVGIGFAVILGQTAEAPVTIELDTATTTPEVAAVPEATTTPATTTTPVDDSPTPQPTTTTQVPTGERFSGTLTEVNTGCFADGECSAVVGERRVILTIGRKQETLGRLVGAESISDLERYVGQTATVYGKRLTNGRYTLYGDADYYLKVTPIVQTGCVVGGCSSQLCVEAGQDVVSTCEWQQKYSCYQSATCERQESGQCGWTKTPDLLSCLASTTEAQN